MKAATQTIISLSPLQIFFACTLLLPFTLTLGVVWLCQAYHRSLQQQRGHTESSNPWSRSLASSDGAAVLEQDSVLLPVRLAV